MNKEQIEKVKMLSKMMDDEIKEIARKEKVNDKWRETHLRKDGYYYPPEIITYAKLKRIMLMLRQETIKLEKLL